MSSLYLTRIEENIEVCADLNINEGKARAFFFDDAGMTRAWGGGVTRLRV